MSGWDDADQMMEEDTGNQFPAVNNITVAGYLPHDRVPAPCKSTRYRETQGKLIADFSIYDSEIKINHRGSLQESETLQEVLQVHAIPYQSYRQP